MHQEARYRAIDSVFGPIAEPFIVPAPQPYIIDLAHSGNENKQEVINRLVESCQILFNILALLGISLKEARGSEYTLNLDTRKRLSQIAWQQNNQAAIDLLESHKW